VPDGVDPTKPVAVICGSGQRSAVAASLLQAFGGRQVIYVVESGLPLWKRQGWPTEQPEKA
jgi:hydroxyacylglutathione hydrolase